MSYESYQPFQLYRPRGPYQPSPTATRFMIMRCRLLNYLYDILENPAHPHVEGDEHILYKGDDLSKKPGRMLYGNAEAVEIPFEKGIPHGLDLTCTFDNMQMLIETRVIVIQECNEACHYNEACRYVEALLPDSPPLCETVKLVINCRIQEILGALEAELFNTVTPRVPGTVPDWLDIKIAIRKILDGHQVDGAFKVGFLELL